MAIIHVNARQYWSKPNGYTLTSTSVWVNGVHVGTNPLAYGRDRSFAIESATAILETANYPVNVTDPHWDESWKDAGHTLTVDIVWVGKRADAYGSNIWRVWDGNVWEYASSSERANA